MRRPGLRIFLSAPHPLQQRSAAQGLPPQAEEDIKTSVFPRLRYRMDTSF